MSTDRQEDRARTHELCRPAASQAAFTWHLVGASSSSDGRITIGNSREAAEVALIGEAPHGSAAAWFNQDMVGAIAGNGLQDMIYYSPSGGQFRAVTVFLMGEWAGALVELDPEGETLEVTQGDAQVYLHLPDGG